MLTAEEDEPRLLEDPKDVLEGREDAITELLTTVLEALEPVEEDGETTDVTPALEEDGPDEGATNDDATDVEDPPIEDVVATVEDAPTEDDVPTDALDPPDPTDVEPVDALEEPGWLVPDATADVAPPLVEDAEVPATDVALDETITLLLPTTLPLLLLPVVSGAQNPRASHTYPSPQSSSACSGLQRSNSGHPVRTPARATTTPAVTSPRLMARPSPASARPARSHRSPTRRPRPTPG